MSQNGRNISELQSFIINACSSLLLLTRSRDSPNAPLSGAIASVVAPMLAQTSTHLPNQPAADREIQGPVPAQTGANDDGADDNASNNSESVVEARSPVGHLSPSEASKSPPSHQAQSDLVASPFYPNGCIQYRLEVPEGCNPHEVAGVGWAMLVYGRNRYPDSNGLKGRSVLFKSCLGLYVCSHDGCSYHERPRVPRRAKRKFAAPMPPQDLCTIHSASLRHVPCRALLKCIISHASVRLEHTGVHTHVHPHPIRPEFSSKLEFEKIVRTASEVKPKSLLIGTRTRRPVSDLHPAFNNLDRTAYLRKKVLRPFDNGSTIGNIANFESEMGVKLFKSSGFQSQNGHIVMQTRFMEDLLRTSSCPLETDSIHGFVLDDHFTDVNVTFTSGFDGIIGRTVPYVISILFGKSRAHYKEHFLVMLQALKFDSWNHFDSTFQGMTCDFSDAERSGFEDALREQFKIPDSTQLDLASHYRFCEVHFKRTAVRVRRNGAIIPPDMEMTFYHEVLKLIEKRPVDEFHAIVASLKTRFPKVVRWLDWHLNPSRAQLIFPALTEQPRDHMRKDTNAQEGLGGDFQKTAPKRKLRIVECVEHVYRYVTNVEVDHKLASQGMKLRYASSKQRRTRFQNDGRPPDTSSSLLRSRSKQTIGRPRGSRNKIPKLGSEIDFKQFGIPWSIHTGDANVVNTCAIDTSLMLLYFAREFRLADLSSSDTFLNTIMDLIRAEKYDEARLRWMEVKMGINVKDNIDVFGTVEDSVTCHLESFLLRTEFHIQCSNPKCPAPVKGTKKSKLLQGHFINMEGSASRFDQDALNALIANTVAQRCQAKYPDDGTGMSCESSGFREMQPDLGGTISEDVCTGTITYVPVCTGSISILSERSIVRPTILQIHVVGGFDFDKISSDLRFAETNYSLFAIIYYNGSHFTGLVLPGSGALYYDGLKTPRLKWVKRKGFKPPSGYRVSHLWYRR